MIVVAGLSADYKVKAGIFKNNATGLEKAEIEHVVGNQYNRLFRQQHHSKLLSASRSTTAADRGEK